MSSLSNQIEKYIKSLLKMSSNNQVVIKRNELAFILSCVPSQINYVLQTRFTPERGFKVESQRGGGGYIRITKITPSAEETMRYLSDMLEKGISYNQCKDLVLGLQDQGIFTKREGEILIEITKAEVLGVPLPLRDRIRAEILKNALTSVIE